MTPFVSASRFFVDAVSAVAPERCAEQWSDEWTVLDLIAHGNRSNVLVVEYSERPVPVAGPDYVLPENIAARADRPHWTWETIRSAQSGRHRSGP